MRTHGNLALETDSLHDRLGNLLDCDLVLLTDGEDDGVNLGVLCERRKVEKDQRDFSKKAEDVERRSRR
jgi:hypothetical protein